MSANHLEILCVSPAVGCCSQKLIHQDHVLPEQKAYKSIFLAFSALKVLIRAVCEKHSNNFLSFVLDNSRRAENLSRESSVPRAVLINISGGNDMTLFEVDEAANRIREEVEERPTLFW